jgi:dTMP kinase
MPSAMTSAPHASATKPALRGRFITFEGGEGAGKSTQVRRLAESLRGRGRTVVETREPGGTPFAEATRALLLDPKQQPTSPLAEALAFYAARADHLAALVRPAIARGAIVLCDRFADSTRAYQGAAGGVGDDALRAIDRVAVGTSQPDLTILLDLPATVGLTRASKRRGTVGHGGDTSGFVQPDGFEGRDLAFHERLRQGFLALAKAEPQRFVVIDGQQNELTISDQVLAVVIERFGKEWA